MGARFCKMLYVVDGMIEHDDCMRRLAQTATDSMYIVYVYILYVCILYAYIHDEAFGFTASRSSDECVYA